MFIIASLSYAISIFIDVFSYHLKVNLHDNKNVRYLLSLINIFQYSARAFVLIYVPVMAYYTETVRDKDVVWQSTLLSHVFVIFLLIPLHSNIFSRVLSIKIFNLLNIVFGKSIKTEFNKPDRNNYDEVSINKKSIFQKLTFLLLTYISGFMFSISITFLYYLSFSYPQKALTLSSYSQILNMFGVMMLVLLIDPKFMILVDKGRGFTEVKLLTTSRILVHVTLILLLFILK
jgi:hypothetical protein